MEPEVVMNLWVFIQSVGPMSVIYELGVRPYMMSGSDDQMTWLLKELAVSDFHFARRFPLPDRYYLKIEDDGGWLRASSGDTMPAEGKVRKGLALVRPDISGMNQMEYFREALDVIEKSLPTRRLGLDGIETRIPSVNRRNLLSVITNVNVDDRGNQISLLDDPRRYEAPSAVANLWMFRDERASAIYALSGRGYMVHGSESERMRILKSLTPNDYQLAQPQPVPAHFSAQLEGKARSGLIAVSSDRSYSKDLFSDVYQSIGQEIPAAIGIDRRLKNTVSASVRESLSLASCVTERSSAETSASPVQLN
jgi:hypothetical protein